MGATGAHGSAALLLAIALGAARVVAAGRRAAPLEDLVRLGGARVVPAVMSGDIAAALRKAARGGAHLTLDPVGGANHQSSVLAELRGLQRNGRQS